MTKRDLIVHELEDIPEKDLDTLPRLIRSVKSGGAGQREPALLAESVMAKDWLSPEEEAAWADL